MKVRFYSARKLINGACAPTDPEREQEVDPGEYVLERISNPFGHEEDWLVLEGTTLGMAESAWLQYDDPRSYGQYKVTIEDSFVEAVSAYAGLNRETVLRTIMPGLIREGTGEIFLPQSQVQAFLTAITNNEEGDVSYEAEPWIGLQITRTPAPTQPNGIMSRVKSFVGVGSDQV